ncbi:hypothetical protein HQ533_06145 [Candidatus Woesearchaeota archaeon]|nr:hypothetical protein [Candidatus Woesearchaeota archaeon]
MKKILIGLLISMLVFSGCLTVIEDTPTEEEIITNFEECAEAGYDVMESYPRQCAANGETFTEEVIIDNGGIALTKQENCEYLEGTWVEGFNECEYISEDQCTTIGGTFNECASACRNDPDAEMCTMQCVIVCEFE